MIIPMRIRLDFHINMGRTYRHDKDDGHQANRKRLRKKRRKRKLDIKKSYNSKDSDVPGYDEDSNFEKFFDKKGR